jgi:hypothetical protein
LHRANASVLIALGLLACGAARQHGALGFSLGGEAHVFVADDRFSRSYYERLTGSTHLKDSLARRALIPLPPPRSRRRAQVFASSGATPATVTLVRFHAPGACGYQGIVTEFVLAFPPTSAGAHPPAPHAPVVAILTDGTTTTGPTPTQPPLSRQSALSLLNSVVARAIGGDSLLRPLALDPDQAADAGEVVPLMSSYGVGFRARVLRSDGDTALITGVASTDRDVKRLRWVIQPRHVRLTGGMIPATSGGVRYSLRGAVEPGALILVDEFTDISARNSRATARSLESGEIFAAQPLALRCP